MRAVVVLVVALVIVASLWVADAEAATVVSGKRVSALAYCYTYNPTVRKKNALGIVLYRMQLDMRWCTRRLRRGRIVSASVSLPWFPYVAQWCCEVVSVSAPVSRYENRRRAYYAVRQAHVKSCVPGQVYCKHYYPYIKARLLNTGKAVLWRYAG